jgi:hypothetical protein
MHLYTSICKGNSEMHMECLIREMGGHVLARKVKQRKQKTNTEHNT